MKRVWKIWSKIDPSTRLGILLSLINVAIAIISKNFLYFIISFPIFLFFVYDVRKELKKVKINEDNKKN
jgi:uncharacterized protein (DUF58 family)